MDKWWVPGLNIGYEHSFVHALYEFLHSLEDGQPAFKPDFEDAARTDAVCEAVIQSAATRQWMDIKYSG